MMERREFIQACAVVAGSAVLQAGCGGGGGGSESGAEALPLSFDQSQLPDLNRLRWEALSDINVSVAHDTFGAIDMVVASVDDEMYDPVTEQFSVVFRGPELPLFEDGVYEVYNSTLGYFQLHLQPGERIGGTQQYRAMFSILRS